MHAKGKPRYAAVGRVQGLGGTKNAHRPGHGVRVSSHRRLGHNVQGHRELKSHCITVSIIIDFVVQKLGKRSAFVSLATKAQLQAGFEASTGWDTECGKTTSLLNGLGDCPTYAPRSTSAAVFRRQNGQSKEKKIPRALSGQKADRGWASLGPLAVPLGMRWESLGGALRLCTRLLLTSFPPFGETARDLAASGSDLLCEASGQGLFCIAKRSPSARRHDPPAAARSGRVKSGIFCMTPRLLLALDRTSAESSSISAFLILELLALPPCPSPGMARANCQPATRLTATLQAIRFCCSIGLWVQPTLRVIDSEVVFPASA
ncbi:hypothetical protein DV736_g5028, partial [Chaetothyriales sp. CBS 134916]